MIRLLVGLFEPAGIRLYAKQPGRKKEKTSLWNSVVNQSGESVGSLEDTKLAKKVLSEDLWCNWRPAGFSTQHRWKLCVSLLQSRKWIHQTADGDVVIKLFTDAPEKHSPRWILKRETRQGMYEWSRDAQSSRCCRSCFFPFLTCCELKNLHVKRSGSDVRGMNIFKRCSQSWKCEDEEEETKNVSSSDSQPVRLSVCVSPALQEMFLNDNLWQLGLFVSSVFIPTKWNDNTFIQMSLV